MEAVLAAVPRHRQDLALIEALDKSLDGAKKTANKKFGDSTAAAGVITAEIAELQQLLQPQVCALKDSMMAAFQVICCVSSQCWSQAY